MKQTIQGLVHRTSRVPIHKGDILTDHHGVRWVIQSASRPHRSGSTGRVYVHPVNEPTNTREFFPGVFNLTWRDSK